MLIPAGAIDALCAVCVRHSEGGEAFETARSVAAATETMRELAKSTTLRPGLRTALDVRALVETARYVPRRVGASAGAAGGEGANDDDDDDDVGKRSREEARKFALTTMHALADPDKNDDAADFRARLRAGDGGHRDGLSALASCLEAPDAEVAVGLKEHAARCVADLAFDEGPCRDECLGSGPRCPSLGKTLRSIVASRSTPSLKLKAAAACAMWRATAPSRGGSPGWRRGARGTRARTPRCAWTPRGRPRTSPRSIRAGSARATGREESPPWRAAVRRERPGHARASRRARGRARTRGAARSRAAGSRGARSSGSPSRSRRSRRSPSREVPLHALAHRRRTLGKRRSSGLAVHAECPAVTSPFELRTNSPTVVLDEPVNVDSSRACTCESCDERDARRPRRLGIPVRRPSAELSHRPTARTGTRMGRVSSRQKF